MISGMDSEALRLKRERWHLAIGAFIEVMGKAEAATHMVLRSGLRPRMYSVVKSLGFTRRLDLIVAMFESYQGLDVGPVSLQANELKRLNDLRNVVAHNSLELQLFDEESDGSGEQDDYVVHVARDERHHPVTVEHLEQQYEVALMAGARLLIRSSELLDEIRSNSWE